MFQTHQSYFVPPQLKIPWISAYLRPAAISLRNLHSESTDNIGHRDGLRLPLPALCARYSAHWCRYMAEVYRLPKHRIYRQQYLSYQLSPALQIRRVRMLCIYYKYGTGVQPKGADIHPAHCRAWYAPTVLWVSSPESARHPFPDGLPSFRALLRQQHQPDRTSLYYTHSA